MLRCCRPPSPHSFPTLRSSDLHGSVPHLYRISRQSDNAFDITLRGVIRKPKNYNVAAVYLGRPAILIVVDQLDRKSTRLNSSHLVTSYAVFCLKRKRSTVHCS